MQEFLRFFACLELISLRLEFRSFNNFEKLLRDYLDLRKFFTCILIL